MRYSLMIEILRKMFEANPEKPTIVLKDKCSDCGCKTIIEITPTSGGFGLQGGALFYPENLVLWARSESFGSA